MFPVAVRASASPFASTAGATASVEIIGRIVAEIQVLHLFHHPEFSILRPIFHREYQKTATHFSRMGGTLVNSFLFSLPSRSISRLWKTWGDIFCTAASFMV